MVETIQQASVDVDRARLLIVADTHGYIDSRIAGLSRSCDVAIHAGDILVAQVLDELQPKQGLIYAVRGNNDRGRGRQLESLPDQCLLSLPGGTLCVEHGHRIWDTKNYHLRLRRKHKHRRVRAIVYGHTHKLVCDIKERPWILNPGAAGRARTFGGPSCLILTARKRQWRVESFKFAPV